MSTVRFVLEPHWCQWICPVDDYTINGDEVTIHPPSDHANDVESQGYLHDDGQAFYYINEKSVLDDGGEWFLDESANKLYYIPCHDEPAPTQMGTTVRRPVVETLIGIDGTSNIQFKGIEFAHTDWLYPKNNDLLATRAVRPNLDEDAMKAAVETVNVDSVPFERNVFMLTGGTGLLLGSGSDNPDVIGNAFRDIAANTLVLVQPYLDEPSTGASNCTVSDNYFVRFGQTYNNGDAIAANWVSGFLVEHNAVWNGPYTGMQIGYGHTGNDTLLGTIPSDITTFTT